MKTREKSLFTIGLIVALGIGFVIGISVNFPKPNQSDLAGTFGKASKYRKVQMTAEDVKLRSELLKDSTQLKKLIQGLVYYSLCTNDIRTNIELCVLAFKAQGMGSQAGEAAKIQALQEYSAYITNNNNTLNTTINMLSGFYTGDTTGQSQDVEKSLRDFGGYVNGLSEKYQVLSQALAGMDNFMLTNKVLQSRKTEITQLKSIRDKLLIKGLQVGAAIGSKDMVRGLVDIAFGSQEPFRYVLDARDQSLNAASARQAVGDLKALGEFNAAGDLKALGEFNAAGDLKVTSTFDANPGLSAGGAIVYSKPDLMFGFVPGGQLNGWFKANPAIEAVATYNAAVLEVKLDNYSMQDIISAMPGQMDAAAGIFSMGNLQLGFNASAGVTAAINSLASDNLGVARGL